MTPASFKDWYQRIILNAQKPKKDWRELREDARTIANKIANDLSSGFNTSNEGKVMRILNETDKLKSSLRALLNELKQQQAPK